MKRSFVAVVALASVTASADAALLQYTMTGSGLAGSVGGTAFTNATVSVTWNYDTASGTGFDVVTTPNLAFNRLIVSPSFSIASAAGNWTGSLDLGLGIAQWQAISYVTTVSPTNSGMIMNGAGTSGPVVQFGMFASNGSLAIDLLSPGSVSGVFGSSPGSFATSFGTVAFDDTVAGSGTFTIAEVPAPGAATLALGAGLVKRRRRR